MDIIRNVILNGQIVDNKTLQNFLDDLYYSHDSRIRLNSFKILDKASSNQQLSDETFFKLELVKAGYGLSVKIDKNDLISFISDQSRKGLILPIDTIDSIENEIDNDHVLDIFLNISKNKQILNYNLISKLVGKFDPNNPNLRLINVFENIAKK